MILDAASPIFQWINSNPELAGLITFLISAGESVAVIGTIVPGSVMMTFIGALIGAGIIPLWSTLIWAILGAIVGDGISYGLGYYFKDSIHTLWPFRRHPQFLMNGEGFFQKYGGASVFIGRFVGPVRALVPVVAGMLGMRPFHFVIANVASALLWAPVYMFPGFLIGAASLEVPTEMGARFLLVLLFIVLIFILCVWLLKKILVLISIEFNQILDTIWNFIKKSNSPTLLNLIKHHEARPHGQLGVAISLVLVSVLFLCLTLLISLYGPKAYTINTLFFHLFRGLRTPALDHIMIYVTLLGESKVLFPIVLTLTAWLSWHRKWHTAAHILALGFLTLVSISFFKSFAHSPRPWGVIGTSHSITNFSFPSGHTTLACVFYFGITLFAVKAAPIKHSRFLYILAMLLIAAIGISRLYFGVHWFTDIVGGCLLGAILLMIITLSYNRVEEKNINVRQILLIFLFTLIVTYTTVIYKSYDSYVNKYKLIDWPIHSIQMDDWWHQRTDLPFFRVNRYGLKSSIFNIQWLGNIGEIKKILLQNGWQVPPTDDWLRIFYRITSVQSTQQLPLIAPLYLDKPPVLVLTKSINNKLIIIRFWDSHFYIDSYPSPLWIGSIEYAPSTYSWLFKKNTNAVNIQSNILFLNNPPYKIKYMTSLHPNKPGAHRKILLIKPNFQSSSEKEVKTGKESPSLNRM